jgi:tetratricopeptide (TPR) repeat protein
MQQIIQQIIDTLTGFISHAEERVMLIEAKDDEAPLLLKSFGMVEEAENVPDIFLSFGDDFHDIRNYVEMMIERQRDQIEQLNIQLEKAEKPLLEQIPDELLQRNAPAHARLAGLFRHIRKIIEPDRQVIWLIYPLTGVEREAFFLQLFGPVVQQIIANGFEGTKLIVRDTPSRLLFRDLGCEQDRPEVLCYQPEVDFPSVMKKIEENANKKDAPVEERVQSTMLMAGIDVAEKRYDSALSKNQWILGHYQRTDQKQNESIVRNNIGDIHYLQSQFPEAQKNYEAAVTIAVAEKSQPLVLYQSMNLGNALFMQQKFDEALIYYDSAEKLAEANKILIQRVAAIGRIGDTKRAKGELDEAIKVYEGGTDLCRTESYKLGLKHLLERLVEAYEEKEDGRKKQRATKELEDCKNELREIDPHFADA